MFCSLVIIIKKFNSINSRKPWPPILISYLFSMAFLVSGSNFFTAGVFWLGLHGYYTSKSYYWSDHFNCCIREYQLIYEILLHIYINRATGKFPAILCSPFVLMWNSLHTNNNNYSCFMETLESFHKLFLMLLTCMHTMASSICIEVFTLAYTATNQTWPGCAGFITDSVSYIIR